MSDGATSGASLSGAVVEQDPIERCGGSLTVGYVGVLALSVVGDGGEGVGVDGCGLATAGGVTAVNEGDSRGSKFFFSLIFVTIRSRPEEVICFSLDLDRLREESSRTTPGL